MSSVPRSRGESANLPPVRALPDARALLIHLTRLALSHNLLTTLPSRLIECKRLRYLNVRYNAMREIPDAVRCQTLLLSHPPPPPGCHPRRIDQPRFSK